MFTQEVILPAVMMSLGGKSSLTAAKVYGGSFHKASSSAGDIAIEREWDVKGLYYMRNKQKLSG